MRTTPHRFLLLPLLAASLVLGGCGGESKDEPLTIVTESGLTCAVLEEGEADARPAVGDLVTVHYTGTLDDGTVFDSSRTKGKPFTFRLGKGQVIKGWDEGVALMEKGSRCVLTIPAPLGYGARGAGRAIPPNATLTFDIELLSFEPGPIVPPAPTFEELDPAKTQTTASGIQYEVIREGDRKRPGPTDKVTVFYSGWLDDGTLFDSGYERGETTTFPLNRVIPGWTEGLQLMREGAVYRFRIPSQLAYGERGRPGIPANAPLNFVVELVSVE